MTALHQEIPEDKLSRVSAYDWFGSVAMVPLATALAGPAEQRLRPQRPRCGAARRWSCVVTAAVLCVPDVRNLDPARPRRWHHGRSAGGGPEPVSRC